MGGIGPESSVVYYRSIIDRYKSKLGTGDYPELIINSINMTEMLSHINNGNESGLIGFLVEKLKVIDSAGADFAAMASNTPHLVFDQVAERTGIPLVSIVEETIKVIKISGLKRIGLFGTRTTMSTGFYARVAARYDIEVVTPTSSDQNIIHGIYMNELIYNNISKECKGRLIQQAQKLQKREDITGLVLGGTEFQLVLSQKDFSELTIFDTTDIHVNSIVNRMVEL